MIEKQTAQTAPSVDQTVPIWICQYCHNYVPMGGAHICPNAPVVNMGNVEELLKQILDELKRQGKQFSSW